MTHDNFLTVSVCPIPLLLSPSAHAIEAEHHRITTAMPIRLSSFEETLTVPRARFHFRVPCLRIAILSFTFVVMQRHLMNDVLNAKYLLSTFPSFSAEAFPVPTKDAATVDCIKVRGSNGLWVQDWDMANRTHYKMPSTYTSWKWQDDSGSCPVHEISKDTFCDIIYDLDIRTFLILGDSFHCMVDWIDSLQHQDRYSTDTNRTKILAFFRPTNRPNFDCLPQDTSCNNTDTTIVYNYTEITVRQSPHRSIGGGKISYSQ